MGVPMADTYRVAGRFLAGEYPGATDAVSSASRIRAIEARGVTHFVDLTHPDDGLEPYEALLAAGVRRLARPIVDFGTVSSVAMTELLDEVDAVRAAGGSLYVHCRGGIGRTGTVVGCWLRRHGLDDGDIVERLARLRAGARSADRSSPETEAQRALVES